MRHIKNIKQFKSSRNSKFKKGDYIMSTKSNKKGIIDNIISSDKPEDFEFAYHLKDYKDNIYLKDTSIILMTPEQIEQYNLEKSTDKFNL